MVEKLAAYKQLRQARERRGWTQEKLAERLGVASTTVSRWEQGETKPRPFERTKIANVLGIPIEDWIDPTEASGEKTYEQPPRPLHEDEQPYPPIWQVPFKISTFIGRQDILQRLHDSLLAGKTTVLTQAISGLGGIGKTVTAARYASMYRSQYKAVFWIEADSPDTLTTGLLKMARELNIPEKSSRNAERVLAAIQRWMKEQRDWLLILDNVEDISLVQKVLPHTRRGHVLLTTRVQVMDSAIVNIELMGLLPEDGALLLLRTAGLLAEVAPLEQASNDEQELAKQLSSFMEGLPLALEQAGAYIKEQACTLSEYLEWYQTRQAEFLQWRSRQHTGNVFYPYSVATTWSLSFDKIREQSPTAVDLLSFYAFLDPDAIPDHLVIVAVSELGPNLQQISDMPALLEVMALLRKYSFVHRNTETRTVHIHRLVQAVFRDQMNEEMRRDWSQRTIRALCRAVFAPGSRSSQEEDLYLLHGQQCSTWIAQWSFRFFEAAKLLLWLAEYASKHMYYSQAEKYFEQAIPIVEDIRAPEHVERAIVYNNAGSFYEDIGKYSLAESYLLKGLSILKKVSLSKSTVLLNQNVLHIKNILAQAMSNLAIVQEKQNRLVEAERYARQAVDLKREENVQDEGLFYALNTLEGILNRQGKTEEASSISYQVHTLFQQLEQTSDLDKAHMLEKQGEGFPMRIDLLEQAITYYQKAYGKAEHPDIAHCLSAIGAEYLERREYFKAKPYYQKALDMYIKTKGRAHDDVVMILTHLALCSSFLGEREEAQAFLEQAMSVAKYNPSPYVSEEKMNMLNDALKRFSPNKINKDPS